MKTGPKYKICRRLGDGVFSKCQTPKFTLSEQKRADSASGTRKRRSVRTEFGNQLIEKQKIRYTYGVNERQLSNLVKESHRAEKRAPQLGLYKLLESRLDNAVFRAGFVSTRPFARQVVSHGHIMVNGRKVTIPSYRVRIGDKISIRPQSRSNKIFDGIVDRIKDMKFPNWISVDSSSVEATIKSNPGSGDDMQTLNFGTVVEFYSRV